MIYDFAKSKGSFREISGIWYLHSDYCTSICECGSESECGSSDGSNSPIRELRWFLSDFPDDRYRNSSEYITICRSETIEFVRIYGREETSFELISHIGKCEYLQKMGSCEKV